MRMAPLSCIAIACAMMTTPDASAVGTARDLVIASAHRYHVPVDLALSVADKESNLRCDVRGSAGEVGPLQIKPSSASALGFKNIRSASCATQTDAGMAHLAECYEGTDSKWKAAACHNQGFSVIAGRRITNAAKRYANAVMAGL